MRVKSIHIYPLKGARALDLAKAAVHPRGLLHDRRWMVVNTDGKFISQREHPKMAQIIATPTDKGLKLQHDQEVFEASTPKENLRPVKIWKNDVSAHDAGDDVASWLEFFLGIPCRLVYQGDISRPVSEKWGKTGDVVSFADGFPLLITNTASLADLNQRMGTPLPMNRFRPNIVIETDKPWAEDDWKKISIGNVEIDIAKPCTRCVVTTTNQITGNKEGPEPLKTLKGFRLSRSSDVTGVIFGQNAIPRKAGDIHTGDKVLIF